ncbi:MAG: extracellular solute-binding protein [Ruminococcaceae bacterium]|nr:extracellular solute-binding protein [Oscillospiraceae bacterium]
MNKKKKKIVKFSVVAALFVILITVLIINSVTKEPGAQQFDYENYDEMEFNPFVTNEDRLDNSLLDYGKVLSKYAKKGYKYYAGDDISLEFSADKSGNLTIFESGNPDSAVVVDGSDAEGALQLFSKVDMFADGFKYTDPSTDKEVIVTDIKDGLYASTGKTTITFQVTVPESALYSLRLDYYLLSGKYADMLVSFTIDEKYPFADASNMYLKRTYTFYDTEYLDNKDIVGNQIRGKTMILYAQRSTIMTNPDGMYIDPYRFYMTAGTHTVTMTFDREPGVINGISFVAPPVIADYEDYKAANGFSNDKIYKGNAIKTELEVPDFVTSIGTRMETDGDYFTSSVVDEKPYKVTLYNIFGGDNWNAGGDITQWTFEVPETGWYELGFRFRSQLTYVACYREIKIDGEIPFEEMKEYCFPYSNGWIATSICDKNQNPYYFYLEAGKHTITITNKIGPMRHSVLALEESMDSISTLINKIVKITASTRSSAGGYVVDANRDWDLQKYIPTIQKDMTTYKELFIKAYKEVLKLNGNKVPSYASAIQVAYELFEKFEKDLETIPTSLNDINNTISGLSTTLSSIKDQPMAMDYMLLCKEGYDYPDTVSSGWQSFKVGVVRFFLSFDKDRYANYGLREAASEDDTTITVYVSRSREYVQVLENMIGEEFTSKYGIKVNVNMVNGGSEGLIMKRYVAGTAPDVAISFGAGTPFEFAIKGALTPLDTFESGEYNGQEYLGFHELKEASYYDEVFVPFNFKDHYYAFPETQGWSAMFYRTDIFEELGLTPPDTWEDIYDILPVLTNAGYDFCYDFGAGNYTPFLFQHGGEYYDYHGMESALTTQAAYDAFIEYTDLYIQYNFVYASNFYMRFKSGEMPIGLSGLGFYSQLNYAAPELDGKWAMLPLPGHARVDENGEVYVDRSTSAGGASCVIMSSSKHKEESWIFLQWWLSDDVQAEYGREIEALFGVAGRWDTANKNAVEELPYTPEELEVIKEQWKWLKETPQTLGDYYTSRYLLTALNQTVLQGQSARVALEDAIRVINKEMKRKQEEYWDEIADGPDPSIGSCLHSLKEN